MLPRLISNISTCCNNDITRHLTTQTGERTVRQMTLLDYEIEKEKVYIIQWSLESYVAQYLDQTSPLFHDHYPHNTSSIHSYYITIYLVTSYFIWAEALMLLITFKPSQVINSFPMWELSPQSRAEQWVASVVTAQESRVEGEAGWDQRRINTAECSLQRGQPASAHLYCPEHTQSASTPAAQSV